MKKEEKLTPEILKKYENNIFIRDTQKELDYYEDLVYGIKKVFGLDVILNEKTEERIAARLTPEITVTARERTETYSDFSREFYLFYLLAKNNFKDESPNKTTKELKEVFLKNKIKSKKKKPCFITIK